jgi:hypothetical protein
VERVGGEPEYAVMVKDELGHEYGVTRIGKPPRKYWRIETLFGSKEPQPDELPPDWPGGEGQS